MREMREIRENNERIMEERGGRGFIFIWGSNAKPCQCYWESLLALCVDLVVCTVTTQNIQTLTR